MYLALLYVSILGEDYLPVCIRGTEDNVIDSPLHRIVYRNNGYGNDAHSASPQKEPWPDLPYTEEDWLVHQ